MWGQAKSILHPICDGWIIPTRVGTRKSVNEVVSKVRDHPHACGDKWLSRFGKNMDWGSSPRVWGQALFISALDQSRRIIPTRVGTRSSQDTCRSSPEDHPHACGDKSFKIARLSDGVGSSPRVWGQERVQHRKYLSAGIIPTRVGTRPPLKRSRATFLDHPHACGDKAVRSNEFCRSFGSSPRVWGQELHIKIGMGTGRIIPTRVGTRNYHPNR